VGKFGRELGRLGYWTANDRGGEVADTAGRCAIWVTESRMTRQCSWRQKTTRTKQSKNGGDDDNSDCKKMKAEVLDSLDARITCATGGKAQKLNFSSLPGIILSNSRHGGWEERGGDSFCALELPNLDYCRRSHFNYG
jgi:hypothetical protein